MDLARRWHKQVGAKTVLLALAGALVIGIVVWQGITAGGNPDPTAQNLTPLTVVLGSGVIVFREGLEAILVLAALTAGMSRAGQQHGRGVAAGAGLALFASVVTWFIVVGLLSAVNAPQLHIQAVTGLLAIVVLLVVMNWFFHKIYWIGWINHHNNRRRRLLDAPDASRASTFWGMVLLGFTAVYREGFEVVLFMQNLRLKAGTELVVAGTGIGLVLTAILAVFTFIAHRRLPYKKMLILTGVLLGVVLIVMVGESAQALQLAGWISTTPTSFSLPGWLGMWFATFPTAEGLISQTIAALLVIGSYVSAQYFPVGRSGRKGGENLKFNEVEDQTNNQPLIPEVNYRKRRFVSDNTGLRKETAEKTR